MPLSYRQRIQIELLSQMLLEEAERAPKDTAANLIQRLSASPDHVEAIKRHISRDASDSEYKYWADWLQVNPPGKGEPKFLDAKGRQDLNKKRAEIAQQEKAKQAKGAEFARLSGEAPKVKTPDVQQTKENLKQQTINLKNNRTEVERLMNELYASKQIDRTEWDAWWQDRYNLEQSAAPGWEEGPKKASLGPLMSIRQKIKEKAAKKLTREQKIIRAKKIIEDMESSASHEGFWRPSKTFNPPEPGRTREELDDEERAEIQRELGFKPTSEVEEDPDIRKMRELEKGGYKVYNEFREALSKKLDEAGYNDYYFYGGTHGESLPSLEYGGALRIIGPEFTEWDPRRQEFINMVKKMAVQMGLQPDEDRPPSTTTFRGERIKSEKLINRPIIYVYKSYHTSWPDAGEIEHLSQFVSPDEWKKLYLPTRKYTGVEWPKFKWMEEGIESIESIANALTEDPKTLDDVSDAECIAACIVRSPSFKIIREEINDAAHNGIELKRALTAPVKVVGGTILVNLFAESKKGARYIDVSNCPISEQEVIDIIAETMLL